MRFAVIIQRIIVCLALLGALTVLLISSLCALPSPAAAPKAAPVNPVPARPNIILVLTDDQGYGDLGVTGNPVLKTPHIDGFAKQSVRFTDFHVSPTCAPTRAALMTGRHEFKNGVTHTINERERMTLKATTIAQVLKKAGYRTGIFGKWHLGDEAEYQPNRRGFEEVFIHGGGGIGQTYAGSCGDAPGNKYFDPAILHNGRFEKTKGYCTDVFFAQALKWMEKQRHAGAPFFTYISLNAPHGPLDVPSEYFNRYKGKVPDNAAKFFGMIENIDDNFGALLKKIDEWGLTENTLVIFMTDNGGTAGLEVFNAGMRGGKATPYQGGTRVPSFWRWPAGFAGDADCAALTAHLDVFPTFAEIAHARITGALAKQVEGRSLLPLLKNPQADWLDRFLVTHVGRWERGRADDAKFSNCSIRDSRFTLVNNKELYDLKSDYGETTNVIEQHADQAARLRAAYDQWWQDAQPLLVNENAVGPKVNPFKALYWKQFGGGPDDALRREIDPPAQPNTTPGEILRTPGRAAAIPKSVEGAAAPQKALPLPGQVFQVDGHTAFVIPPSTRTTNHLVPWVWYAPTLPGLPGNAEQWMFERFTLAGIAIAGIDVGESYGSPAGRALYSAFHEELTRRRGFAPKAVLLGRSRGGLMTLSWAAEHPDKVAGFAGIYPVCNVASYPGVAKAAGAYRMTPEQLSARLTEHNPIDRLAPLARAGVPLFAIHGDVDKVVPLEANSGLVKERYTTLGGSMQLIVPPGQGHNMWVGFFQSQELVNFVKTHARWVDKVAPRLEKQ